MISRARAWAYVCKRGARPVMTRHGTQRNTTAVVSSSATNRSGVGLRVFRDRTRKAHRDQSARARRSATESGRHRQVAGVIARHEWPSKLMSLKEPKPKTIEEVLQRVEHETDAEGRRAFEGFLKKMHKTKEKQDG